MGGKHLRVADVPPIPGTPTVHVRAYPIMGGVNVRSRQGGEGRRAVERGHHRHRHATDAIEAARREWEPLAAEWWRDDWNPVPSSLRDVPAAPSSVEATPVADLPADVPQAPDGTVTILFSDVAGSTAMNERVGDLRAVEVLRAHAEIVRGQLVAHSGHEVKTQGDGVMAAFTSSHRALRAAIAIQRAVQAWDDKHRDDAFDVHIGLHTGEAIREGNDYLGQTVILASRLTSEAGPGEILASSLLKELAESLGEFEFGDVREVTLKGLSGPRRVYPVVWRNGS
jgi:class 3 adenylate cyclase